MHFFAQGYALAGALAEGFGPTVLGSDVEATAAIRLGCIGRSDLGGEQTCGPER